MISVGAAQRSVGRQWEHQTANTTLFQNHLYLPHAFCGRGAVGLSDSNRMKGNSLRLHWRRFGLVDITKCSPKEQSDTGTGWAGRWERSLSLGKFQSRGDVALRHGLVHQKKAQRRW